MEVRRHSATTPLFAKPNAGCVACGQNHPSGLRIAYRHDADGSIQASWIPAREWEGFEGIIHGGIISTVLDEAMSKAVAGVGTQALTGELRLRFRHHVEPGEEVRIRGWIVKRTRRLIQTEATLRAADGSERAHAWATFMVLDGKGQKADENCSTDQ